jgi:Domain of unknown function (DUF4214)/Calpain family cysteine protease
MTASSTTSSSSQFSYISNSFIINDLNTYASNSILTYSGLLNILNDVSSHGSVTSSELSDLKQIYSHLNNGISTNDYVYSIYNSLLNGSPANATWTGGLNSSQPLGNLAVGSTQTQLNELIGKWFLGTDLPDPTYAKSNGSNYTPKYSGLNYSLYGSTGDPQTTDVNQGAAGDCVICSTMVQLALNDPQFIKNMITSDGNNIYGVRFYLNGTSTWVTVNNQLPVNSSGRLLPYAYTNSSDVSLWAQLVEKAFVELTSTGLIKDGPNSYHPAVNAYQNTDGNYAKYILNAFTNLSSVDYNYTDRNWYSEKSAILSAVNDHKLVLVSSEIQTFDANGKSDFQTSHEESIVGYDTATGDFIIRNPWGVSSTPSSQTWNTQFEASMTDIANVKGYVDISAAPSSSPVSTFIAGPSGGGTIPAGTGINTIVGGNGINTVTFSGTSSQFHILVNSDGTETVAGPNVTDTLNNIQNAQFNDLTLDLTSFTKMVSLQHTQIVSLVQLYVASFNRAPDSVGLDYWGGQLSGGMTLQAIAKSFFVQPEATLTYPTTMSTGDFVAKVYNNVLSRAPDTGGLNYWTGQLANGSVSKDAFLLAIINGAMAATGSLVDQQTLANKEAVGEHYAIYQGLNNSTTWAQDVMSGVTSVASTVTAANAKADAYAAIAANPLTSDLVVKLVGVAV